MRADRTLLRGCLIGVLALALPAAAAAATYKTLYSFGATAGDGKQPFTGLTLDFDGALYGTTNLGGTANLGTVFKLTPPAKPGAAWTESVLHSFAGGTTDGSKPTGNPGLDAEGVLYGTTTVGGTANLGTVYKLTPNGDGTYTESVLHSFAGGSADGATPNGGLALDSNGGLYGTTQFGGSSNCTGGCGVVFKLTPGIGGTYTKSILHSFAGAPGDGANPRRSVFRYNLTGAIFGATYAGGSTNNGIVFKLTPGIGGTYTESILYNFKGGASDGSGPYSVFLDFNGAIFGTTNIGGTANLGTVFKLKPGTGGTYTESILYNFKGGTGDGSNPSGAILLSNDSMIYGATVGGGAVGQGIVFALTPSGAESVLYSFGTTSGGGLPGSSLRFGAPSQFFGTTPAGGAFGVGTVFQLVGH